MRSSVFKEWFVILSVGFAFIGFVLNFLDIRQWWDNNLFIYFEYLGSDQPARDSLSYQIFFLFSLLFILTVIGVVAILLERMLRFLFTDFELRSLAFDLDFSDFSGSALIQAILAGMALVTFLCLLLYLVAGMYPTWEEMRAFLLFGLPTGAVTGIFITALFGALGEFPQNLAFALLGIGLGTYISINNWSGLAFPPRIVVLGGLGFLLGFPGVRIRLLWFFLIILAIIVILAMFIGGVPL